MEVSDFVTLLQVDGASGFGVLLAATILLGLALQREWLVTGARYRADTTRDDAALKAATEALKTCERDYVESRITIARHEERERWSNRQPPPRTRGTKP